MDKENLQEQELLEELTSDQQRTGVEVEKTSDDAVAIVEPFDPEKIDVKTKPMTVDLIMARIRGGDEEIDLMPDFQRRAGIWDLTRKSRLIESLLLRIPLPVFYVASNQHDCWSVVDGLQRITTLKEFIHDKELVLQGLEFLHKLNGKKFVDLNRQMQRRILESEVTVHIIQPGTPSPVMFNIFKRINTGGLPLSAQEIRHAIKQGAATKLLKELAESKNFKEVTRNSIRDERMADRECVLRFCAFYITPPNKYNTGDLDALLIQTMDEINSWPDNKIQDLTKCFKNTMDVAKRIFGKWAFRKYYGYGNRLSPINKALFEVWAVHLSKLSNAEVDYLEKYRDDLMKRFAELMMKDYSFQSSISVATGSVSNVRERFNKIEKLIQGVMHAEKAVS
ncbi:DUF262 domain-containing protein [Methylomonas sp. SURF-1]|uniref:DUF262 domain-containing protein n=1 Tax=Methylomonas aurea TaxID=2952224 RepID=A0ABT1UFV3_9GAMM|nr:DUF262 domain-containing protein [Methylomonas sp. SURF-1]MCQ8181108.1 DUF262 domain-containing protein [Methylomonas sp. SURF-1]